MILFTALPTCTSQSCLTPLPLSWLPFGSRLPCLPSVLTSAAIAVRVGQMRSKVRAALHFLCVGLGVLIIGVHPVFTTIHYHVHHIVHLLLQQPPPSFSLHNPDTCPRRCHHQLNEGASTADTQIISLARMGRAGCSYHQLCFFFSSLSTNLFSSLSRAAAPSSCSMEAIWGAVPNSISLTGNIY